MIAFYLRYLKLQNFINFRSCSKQSIFGVDFEKFEQQGTDDKIYGYDVRTCTQE